MPSSPMDMTPIELLAELAIDTRTESLPATACEAARVMVLDSLATAIGGWDADGVEPVLEQLREWGGRGQSTVLVHGDRLPAPHAAFANAVLIHALDFDDLYRPAALHLMSSILPVSLAAAELEHRTGRDLLAGIILGVEVAARLGLAMRALWKPVQAAGFLPSTIVGGFGATAAAARLLGLDRHQTAHALGLYYAQNAGNRQALYDKTLTKRMQPALAARSALWSAQLARRGITGPLHAIDGDAGLVRLYAGSTEAFDTTLLQCPRARWQIEELAIKRFPSCGACHPLTQAALDLIAETRFDVAAIETVTVYLGEGGNRMVGMPFELGETPQADAQFSVAYAVALVLLRHDAGIARYTAERIRADHAVLELARRITILEHMADPPRRRQVDDDEPAWVDQPHVLTITLHDGRSISRSRSIRDVLSPEHAVMAVAADKLRSCATHAGFGPASRVDAILEAVNQLEQAPDIQRLMTICTRMNEREMNHG